MIPNPPWMSRTLFREGPHRLRLIDGRILEIAHAIQIKEVNGELQLIVNDMRDTMITIAASRIEGVVTQ